MPIPGKQLLHPGRCSLQGTPSGVMASFSWLRCSAYRLCQGLHDRSSVRIHLHVPYVSPPQEMTSVLKLCTARFGSHDNRTAAEQSSGTGQCQRHLVWPALQQLRHLVQGTSWAIYIGAVNAIA